MQRHRLHIFRAGRHVSMAGDALAFSEAEIAATAGAYDPALHEAPIVVGHPRTDAPAYGWVGRLEAEGASLVAEAGQVEPAFAEMVRAGRFKKISAAFYPPASAVNPRPGVYYLKHVGFLGAQAPAVKGLKQAEFAATDAGETVEVEIAFAELGGGDLALFGFGGVRRVFASLREWLLTTAGAEVADRVVPPAEIESLRTTEEFLRARQRDEQDRMTAAAGDPGRPAPQFAETRLSRELNRLIDAAADGEADERRAVIDRLAEAAGIERGTVLQILRGEIETPPEERLAGFARALGVRQASLTALVELGEAGGRSPDDATTRVKETTMPEAALSADDLARREQEFAERERDVARREAAFAEREAEARRAEDRTLIEDLVKDGRLAPGLKAPVLAFLEALDPKDEIAFGEQKATPRAWFRDLLARHTRRLISFGELAADGRGAAPPAGAAGLEAVAHRLVREAAAEGRTLSFAEAARQAETMMEG